MKLINKTSKYYLVFVSIILVLAGIAIFIFVTGFINEEITEKLTVNVKRIASQIKDGNELNSLKPIHEISIIAKLPTDTLVVNDLWLFDEEEGEEEYFREVIYYTSINGSNYEIINRQVIFELHDYLGAIGIPILIVIFLLLIGLNHINRRINRTIWSPFFENLKLLKTYSVESESRINLVDSNIEEFRELSHAIVKLTNRITSDFASLREFTENASHELQTPLAIIQNQLEQAVQISQSNPELNEILNSSMEATSRLKKLNKSLILLSKIQSKQYEIRQELNLHDIIKPIIDSMMDLIQSRNLVLTMDLPKYAVRVKSDQTLINSLFSNLVYNAISHNVNNGKINILLDEKTFQISNTGEALNASPESMFERFRKSDKSTKSIGLGLSIVKKICDYHNWTISYQQEQGWHHIKIVF